MARSWKPQKLNILKISKNNKYTIENIYKLKNICTFFVFKKKIIKEFYKKFSI